MHADQPGPVHGQGEEDCLEHAGDEKAGHQHVPDPLPLRPSVRHKVNEFSDDSPERTR